MTAVGTLTKPSSNLISLDYVLTIVASDSFLMLKL